MTTLTDPILKCVLGQLLWCFHAGGRWSDSQRIKSIEVSQAGDETILICGNLGSKTALSKETKTRFVPFMCVGTGLSGLTWASRQLNGSTCWFVLGLPLGFVLALATPLRGGPALFSDVLLTFA